MHVARSNPPGGPLCVRSSIALLFFEERASLVGGGRVEFGRFHQELVEKTLPRERPACEESKTALFECFFSCYGHTFRGAEGGGVPGGVEAGGRVVVVVAEGRGGGRRVVTGSFHHELVGKI